LSQVLTIQLPDGLSIEMDETEWLQLASACHHLTEKGYFDSDLIVRKHTDDRTLVYVVVKNPEGGIQLPLVNCFCPVQLTWNLTSFVWRNSLISTIMSGKLVWQD
jgi:hypothetical protein